MQQNTTGIQNTAFGQAAGQQITTGSRNVAVGYNALDSLTTANDNTAIGHDALTSSTSGPNNTAVGRAALNSLTTASNCVAVGLNAARNVTSGSANTCVGRDAGDTIDVGYSNVCVGNNVNPSTAAGINQIVIGHDFNGIGHNYFTFGKSSNRVYNLFTSNASWTRSSDVRLKKDIQTNTDLGLAFINDLRTVTYKWKAPSELDSSLSNYDASKTEADYTNKMYGFIAQEVKQALDDHNVTDFAGWHVTDEADAIQGVSYEMFVMPLVKAVQELSAENTALKARLDAAGI